MNSLIPGQFRVSAIRHTPPLFGHGNGDARNVAALHFLAVVCYRSVVAIRDG
jgi:hypothetical protein